MSANQKTDDPGGHQPLQSIFFRSPQMSKGIKAVLPWMTFILSIILCAFLIYVAFFSYQAGKAPTVNKVEANITLVLAIILAVLVALLMIWSIVHLYLSNKTKPKEATSVMVPETKPLPKASSKADEASPSIPTNVATASTPSTSETKAYGESVTNPVRINRVTVQPKEVYTSTVSDPGSSSAMQDLLRSAAN